MLTSAMIHALLKLGEITDKNKPLREAEPPEGAALGKHEK